MEQDHSKVDVSEDAFYTDEHIAKLESFLYTINRSRD